MAFSDYKEYYDQWRSELEVPEKWMKYGPVETIFAQGFLHGVKSTKDKQNTPNNELMWLFTHCRAIGMLKKSDSGKMEHDIALFTADLKEENDRLCLELEEKREEASDAWGIIDALKSQEPVVYEYRCKPNFHNIGYSDWKDCTKEKIDEFKDHPLLYEWCYETRELFSTPQSPVSDGYKLIPMEPTEEMIQAGCLSQSEEKFDTYEEWKESHSNVVSSMIRSYVIEDYKAMIGAVK